jgi:L-alanine-DL-glutamate epimerase-like enolase superfamily enzyme
MKKFGLSFVEQPLHHNEGAAAWMSLHSHLTSPQIPLYADESVQNVSDLQGLSEIIQGVNVKLLKTVGFAGALKLIARARSLGLKVILGCMVESSIGVTAAAHLAGTCDWVDLDGHLHLREDDFEGLTFSDQGRVQMPEGFGLGINSRPCASLLEEPI